MYGIARPLRILVFVPLAAALAGLFLVGQELLTSDPVILANASAQVLVVSFADVVVCWALFGAVLRNALGPGFGCAAIAVVSAALVFGLYHYAHSRKLSYAAAISTGVGLLASVAASTGRIR